MLRRALSDEFDGEAFARSSADSDSSKDRFEHYELAKDEDGMPIELGRGAGITYKALDVDLRCPVTLKVISERYLGDESAQLRFLREARAAASVRHPNVASVFHLGRTGSSYFYAMEFVEGETLERLIRRSGRVEVKLALEIMAQVAAGLAAVYEQNLVHRDIKPSNIMVRLKDEGSITAKIIDLGLAKAVNEPSAQTAISTPGGFAGTPEFASPEQFAGIGADIRSDLYSLGITLWEMLAGEVPFRGTPGEVMHQHQHAPLPLEQLEDVPQPVAVLLEVLLEKDPARRFQSPTDLLKVILVVKRAAKARRTILEETVRAQGVPQAVFPSEKIQISRSTTRIRKPPRKTSLGRRIGRKMFLELWDFTPLLVEKLKGFTGREWLFQEIEEWRARGSSPALLLIGEPGHPPHWSRRDSSAAWPPCYLRGWMNMRRCSKGRLSPSFSNAPTQTRSAHSRPPSLGLCTISGSPRKVGLTCS
jgi:serine/threonine protein kinase